MTFEKKQIKILALDDDKFIRRVLHDIFEGKYIHEVCTNKDEFNYHLNELNPDVIFLDIEMPDANGIDICRTLKNSKNRSHVIMMSGIDNSETVRAAYDAGADDYIRKPFLNFEILSKIEMVSKNLEYSRNIQKLLSHQKKMTDSILKLTSIINQNTKITEKGNLFSTIFQVTGFIHCDYTCVIISGRENEKVEQKLLNNDFKYVEIEKLKKVMRVFNEKLVIFQNVKLKNKNSQIIHCYVRKIFFNEELSGYLVIQNQQEFSVHVFDLITLYMDFVNLKGTDIVTDILLKDELRKERDEIEKVRTLQVALLPDFHEVDKFDVASTFIPMEQLSGDFFDGFYISDCVYQIVVCDVSGHGIASSYVGSSIRGIVRSSDYKNSNAAEIVTYLNAQMFQSFEGVYYFSTLVLCQLNVKTGKVVIVSAGHPPCFYYDASKDEYKEINSTGPLVGLIENAQYEQVEIEMCNEDVLLIYTDGISEAMHPETGALYGEENILKSLTQECRSNSMEIVHSVIGNAYEYTGYASFEDDVTLLCMKRNS